MKIPEEVKISDNGFVFNSKTGDSFSLNPFGLELIKNIQDALIKLALGWDVKPMT
jgi:hypothetical protein